MRKVIVSLLAFTAIIIAIILIFAPPAKPHTKLYWVCENSLDSSRYLYCYNMNTEELTYDSFNGYIIYGDTSGKGFYFVDNNMHVYSDIEVYDFVPFTPKESTPFNIYRYTENGVKLVKEELYYDDLYLVVAYYDGNLWYLNGYNQLVMIDSSGSKNVYPNVYSEYDYGWEYYPVNSLGQKILYINSKPDRSYPDSILVTTPDAVPSLAVQMTDGTLNILHSDVENIYDEFRAPVYSENKSCIYYFAKRNHSDIFTYYLMEYDLSTHSNTEYMINGQPKSINYCLDDQIPIAISSDGNWIVGEFYNYVFDGIAALSLSGDGLLQIFNTYEYPNIYPLQHSHIGIITCE